jgi:hypothetical protein
LYRQFILHELKLNSPDFNRLCNHVSEIQRLTRSRNKEHGHEKEVHLSFVQGGGMSCGKCRNAVKSAGSGPRHARSAKKICMVDEQVRAKGAIPAMVAQTRCVASGE